MKTYVSLSLYGQKAVDWAYAIQNGKCYAHILGENGRKIAQMEVVIDQPGTYNGLEQKWVDVTILDKNPQTVVRKLAEIGFAGCWALIALEQECGGFIDMISDPVFMKIE